jgi:hypothetical protein
MIDPAWVLVGDGTLRRGEGEKYTGNLDVVGFPYKLVAHVQVDDLGKFFAIRVYNVPRQKIAPPAEQAGLALDTPRESTDG